MKSQITITPDGKSVIKRCRSVAECTNELRVYKLNLPYTPQLLKLIDDRTLELTRIIGRPFSTEIDFDFSMPGKMLATLHLSDSHQDQVLCHLDTNPRNYLIEETTGKYFMLDFSESNYSYAEHDLINFLLFWAAILEPDHFERAMQDFLTGYHAQKLLNRHSQPELFTKWIKAFDDRRRKYCKNPCTVAEWQERNRKYLLNNFYRILSIE